MQMSMNMEIIMIMNESYCSHKFSDSALAHLLSSLLLLNFSTVVYSYRIRRILLRFCTWSSITLIGSKNIPRTSKLKYLQQVDGAAAHTQTLFLSFSLSLSLSLSLSFSDSLTHTHTHTHTRSLSYTHTHRILVIDHI